MNVGGILHDYLEHEWYIMGMWKLQCVCKHSVWGMYECVYATIWDYPVYMATIQPIRFFMLRISDIWKTLLHY